MLVSAPGDKADLTVVYGVNHGRLTRDHLVVSNASCTTNCLAPVAKVMHEAIGIDHGFMTTIHSYTGDQPTLDTMHKDLYRARAAAMSMIPTTTGAAKAVGLVLPELAGKLDGTSIRVPTPNVSVIDFKFVAKRATDVTEVREAVRRAAAGELKGILGELSDGGARVVLLAHFGRPKGGYDAQSSLQPLAAPLARALGRPVAFAPDCVGERAEAAVAALRDGDVLLLENTRFHAGETKNDPAFVAALAKVNLAISDKSVSGSLTSLVILPMETVLPSSRRVNRPS